MILHIKFSLDKKIMEERKHGLHEGIARGLSQACVYTLEAQKTLLQVYGKLPCVPPHKMVELLTRGMGQSILTSSTVFTCYFSVYNHVGMQNPLAGSIATFSTSLIKTPIANGMRLIQAGVAPHLPGAWGKIVKSAQGMRGLYSGYGTSMIEDIIEMDMRVRMYQALRKVAAQDSALHPIVGLGLGAISGMLTSWITTPFDTLKANMIMDSTQQKQICVWKTTKKIWKQGGVRALYRGGKVRAMSNGIKAALFYLFLEMLQGVDKYIHISQRQRRCDI